MMLYQYAAAVDFGDEWVREVWPSPPVSAYCYFSSAVAALRTVVVSTSFVISVTDWTKAHC